MDAENPKCGTRQGYRRGCHCRSCLSAEAQYAAQRSRLLAYGQWKPFVDAEPVRAHVRSLQDFGLGRRRIAQLAAVSERTVSNLLYGANGMPPARRIRVASAEKILAVRPRLADVHDHIPVHGAGTRRRLRALYALGWTSTHLAREVGVARQYMSRLLTAPEDERVAAATARTVARVYDRLWNRDPVAGGVVDWAAKRASSRAASHGWAPPQAWDDETIDDPAATSDLGAKARRQDALLEDAQFIVRTTGVELDQVALRLGVTRNYLEKVRERAGRELAACGS